MRKMRPREVNHLLKVALLEVSEVGLTSRLSGSMALTLHHAYVISDEAERGLDGLGTGSTGWLIYPSTS